MWNYKISGLITVLILITFTAAAWSDNGLSVSPGSVNITMQGPQVYQGHVSVTNIGNSPMNITVDKKRMLEDTTNTLYMDDGIATWISVGLATFTLAPGETKSVNYTVNVPTNVNYNDAQGALLIKGIPSQNTNQKAGFSSQVVQAPEIVVPIIVGLPGQIVQSLSMVSNHASSVLLSLMPGSLEYKVNNNGTVQANMVNNITVNGLFENRNLNTTKATVFPGDNYTIKSQWTPGFFDMGIYSINSNISYGREKQNETLTSKNTVFVFPSWIILVILVIITGWIIRKKGITSPIEIKRKK